MSAAMLGINEMLRQFWCSPLVDLVIKLNSEDRQEWERALTAFLHKENPWEMLDPKVPEWKSVKLGSWKSWNELRDAIITHGIVIGDRAIDVFNRIKVSSEKIEIRVVHLTVAELGFETGATYENISKRATELGLLPCPSEVAPELCLQFRDQLENEELLFVMSPLIDSKERPLVFYLSNCKQELFLGAFYQSSDMFYDASRVFIFACDNRTH